MGERNLSSSSFDIACRVMKALGLDPTKYHNGDYVIGDEVEITPEGLRYVADGVLLSDIRDEDDE